MLSLNVAIKNLEIRAGKDKILFIIPELKLSSGSKTLIRGPSGVGKSTLLHMIGGLTPAARGEVRIDDISISDIPLREKDRIRSTQVSFIFQRLNLIEFLNVEENICLAPTYGHLIIDQFKKYENVMKRLGIWSLRYNKVKTLSLGECQRVAVARTLLSPAKIILADEPTSSLDLKNAESVFLSLTQDLGSRTLICVSHDERMVKYFDQVIDVEKWLA